MYVFQLIKHFHFMLWFIHCIYYFTILWCESCKFPKERNSCAKVKKKHEHSVVLRINRLLSAYGSCWTGHNREHNVYYRSFWIPRREWRIHFQKMSKEWNRILKISIENHGKTYPRLKKSQTPLRQLKPERFLCNCLSEEDIFPVAYILSLDVMSFFKLCPMTLSI